MGAKLKFLIKPFETFIRFYEQILSLPKISKTLVFGFVGLILGWWVYVPVHELLHVAGCLLGGGEVICLEIDPLYGGAILSDLFPFVVSGSDYAGRLSGFDTHGSDWVYALTIVFPFVISLLGFLFLQVAVRKKSPFMFAFVLPCALAPLISLSGDFFELGSLFLFQVWPGPSEINRLLISDDVFRLMTDINLGVLDIPLNFSCLSFIGASFGLGALFAWVIFMLSEGIRSLLS